MLVRSESSGAAHLARNSWRIVLLSGALALLTQGHASLASAAPALPSALAPRAAKSPSGSGVPEQAATATATLDEKVAPDSPRAAVTDFRHLTRKGDFAGAARYLDLSKVDQADGAELAEHLNEVLNRHLWIEPEKLSPNSHGNPEDGLKADTEQLGSVPGASGALEPVVLVRKSYRPGSTWLFSADTVGHIDGWYDHLGNLWLAEHMPKVLQHMGPHHMRRWQWLALGPLALGAWLFGFAVTRLSRVVVRRALSERSADAIRKLRGSATLGCAVAACYLCLPWLGLYEPAEALVQRWLSAGLLLAVFWAVWKTVELSQRSVSASRWAKESLTAHSLLLLGARLAKFAVAAVAMIVVAAELGYHATALITGLGIGGIALALAAQKTVENLFGAFSLAIDQPFRQGDTIQVDTVSGTVEAIGLRSTRLRTADRTVISIPNGKLADMRVETINRQDQLRLYCLVSVAHSASSRIGEIIRQIEALLKSQPAVAKSSVGVHLVALTDSGLNLEIAAMFETTDGDRFAAARHAVLLGTVEIIERAGGTLAHPVRRIEMALPNEARVPESGTHRHADKSRSLESAPPFRNSAD